MSLLRPVPWTTQPQGAVEIDWNNPITRGLVFAMSPAVGAIDLISKSGVKTDSGSLSEGVGLHGRAIVSAGGVRTITNPNNALCIIRDGVTHLFVAKIDSVDSPWGGIFSVSDASTNSAFGIQRNNATQDILVYRDNTRAHVFSGALPKINGAGNVCFAVASNDITTSAGSLAINGIVTPMTEAIGVNGSTAGTTGLRAIYFGERSASPTYGSNGSIFLHLAFNRMLSDDELSEITNNPWQIFKPLSRKLYIGTANTGPVDHTTGGDIVGNAASVSGSAELIEPITIHQATGSVVGNPATVTGIARRFRAHSALGELLGDLATVTGTAELVEPANIHQTFGDVIGFDSSVSGVSTRTRVHPSTGAVKGLTSTVVGQSQIDSPPGVHECFGDIAGSFGDVAGIATHLKRHTTTGTVIGRATNVVGEAVKHATHNCDGSPVGYGSTIIGSASKSGSMTLTPADIQAIVDALVARVLPVNIVQVNSVVVDGTGAPGNEWGPV